MKFGVCLGVESTENIALAKKAGFDYIETGFCGLSRSDDAVIEKFYSALDKSGLRCEAANGFLPRDLPILGAEADFEKSAAYIEKGMLRGARCGLETVVFGSSAARRIPDGMSYAEGVAGIAAFLKEVVSPIARRYGVRVVTEPLRKDETNCIHSVSEGALLAMLVNEDNIGALADIYHMLGVNDTWDDISRLGGLLTHAHISYPLPDSEGRKRTYPKDENEFDYRGFVSALEKIGCRRVSVEAGIKDFASEAPVTAKLLKGLLDG